MENKLEMYKFSNYNHKINLPEGIFIYNSLSGGFCKVDEDIVGIFNECDLLPESDMKKLECLSDKIIEELIKGGFLISKDIDELKLIKSVHNISRFSNSNSLGLTLLPTLGCNFRCTYCFEKGSNYPNTEMTEEVMDAIIKFIDDKLQKGGRLALTWYGGEPLMKFDTIKKLQLRINKLAKEKDLILTTGMISNGYLLTKDISNELVNLGITSMQVTIDGSKEVHDKKRILANGKGTFEKIISNLIDINENMYVSIRINIEKNNIDTVPKFLDYLNEIGLGDKKNIAPYFAVVMDYDTEKEYISNTCYTIKDFSKEEIYLDNIAHEKGFATRDNLSPNLSSCGAVAPNTFLIEPDGTIQKCWNVVGNREEGIGNVLNSDLNNDRNIRNKSEWYSWSLFEDEECKKCSVLPLCMGGCPYFTINKNDIFENSKYRCVTAKFNLEETLKTLAYRHLSKLEKTIT